MDQDAAAATREIEEISRSLTVQCSFSLVDAVTGRSVLHHAPPVYQKTDRKSPDFFFGQYIEEADLDPVDHFIGELVERAARDFASMLVPVVIEQQYEIIGRGKAGERAVRALRGDDLAGAIELFEKEHADEDDEPDTVFALGVTCEMAGQYKQALSWYQKLVSMKDVDDDDLPMYMDAKNRLAAHMNRIIREPAEPAEPSPAPPP
jgi:tetratricopeptide (TPR) repeat protein